METGEKRDEERDQHDEEMDMGLGDDPVDDLGVPTVAITAAEEIDVRTVLEFLHFMFILFQGANF
jgi:hypothetical protein